LGAPHGNGEMGMTKIADPAYRVREMDGGVEVDVSYYNSTDYRTYSFASAEDAAPFIAQTERAFAWSKA